MLRDIDGTGVAAAAQALGPMAMAVSLDVRDEAAWQITHRAVLERLGRLDVLVNNAGITGFEGGAVPHDPEHAELADWHAVLGTNLDVVFLGCKHAIRATKPPASAAPPTVAI